MARPKWLAWHVFAVLATIGMLWLGDWQLHRALSGNELSWAYTFEWPIFAVCGIYFWTRTIREEHRMLSGAGLADGSAAHGPAAGAEEESATSARAAEEAYLARLKAEVRGHGRWHGFR